MQLKNKPILIEGSPGVGKTSLAIALAKLAGYSYIRINLSEQTDISDLFGSDLPDVQSGKAGKFKWHDGPLLTAIKNNQWIILDEVSGEFLPRFLSTKFFCLVKSGKSIGVGRSKCLFRSSWRNLYSGIKSNILYS